MKRKSLTEFLDDLNEAPLEEFAGTGSPAGAAMDQRPDMSGFRGKGAAFNFKPRNDAGTEWPYEDSAYAQYGRSMGNKGRDRGDRPGEDLSGGPPTPKYQNTWEGGPEEVEESPDYEESQRHGLDKYRNVWRDTPDGKQWTKQNQDVEEGMGSPGRIGPFAPMDGPSMQSFGRDAKPVKDVDGDDVSPEVITPPYRDMSGPGNMWGGPGTIPGATGGWANMPPRPEDEDDPEKNPMKLREFFNPEPIPVEEIDNPEQDHLEDQSDDELEGQMDSEEPGEEMKVSAISDKDFGDEEGGFDPSIEEPDSFSDRLGGTSISIVPNLGKGSEFISSPDKMGAARGTFGLQADGGKGNDIVGKSSAWDVLQKVVTAMSQNSEEPGEDF